MSSKARRGQLGSSSGRSGGRTGRRKAKRKEPHVPKEDPVSLWSSVDREPDEVELPPLTRRSVEHAETVSRAHESDPSLQRLPPSFQPYGRDHAHFQSQQQFFVSPKVLTAPSIPSSSAPRPGSHQSPRPLSSSQIPPTHSPVLRQYVTSPTSPTSPYLPPSTPVQLQPYSNPSLNAPPPESLSMLRSLSGHMSGWMRTLDSTLLHQAVYLDELSRELRRSTRSVEAVASLVARNHNSALLSGAGAVSDGRLDSAQH